MKPITAYHDVNIINKTKSVPDSNTQKNSLFFYYFTVISTGTYREICPFLSIIELLFFSCAPQ